MQVLVEPWARGPFGEWERGAGCGYFADSEHIAYDFVRVILGFRRNHRATIHSVRDPLRAALTLDGFHRILKESPARISAFGNVEDPGILVTVETP